MAVVGRAEIALSANRRQYKSNQPMQDLYERIIHSRFMTYQKSHKAYYKNYEMYMWL